MDAALTEAQEIYLDEQELRQAAEQQLRLVRKALATCHGDGLRDELNVILDGDST